VADKVMFGEAVKLNSVSTVEGSSLIIDATSGVKVNSATVVTPDVEAENGVIYVIGSVLIP
jgi:uncharacterized surface protein with fasciclin (FAS1) repeats